MQFLTQFSSHYKLTTLVLALAFSDNFPSSNIFVVNFEQEGVLTVVKDDGASPLE